MGRRSAAAYGSRRIALAALIFSFAAGPALAKEKPARLLFGGVKSGSAGEASPVGGYAKGCIAGAVQLPPDGPGFQAMRPSRNRAWGHPILKTFLQDLAQTMQSEGHAGMLVGDMSQPRGGPMKSGHRSHQSGLDADIWFRPAPDYQLSRDERQKWSAYSVVAKGWPPKVNDKFDDRVARLIQLTAWDDRTARVFVAAIIKKQLCEMAPTDNRAWLRKVRPWYGHKDHLHVRLKCPYGAIRCVDQKPPPPGDGCGKAMAFWFKPAPKPVKPVKPKKRVKKKPRKEVMLSHLPEACATILKAPAG